MRLSAVGPMFRLDGKLNRTIEDTTRLDRQRQLIPLRLDID